MDEGKNTTSTETEAQEGGLSNAQLEPPRLGNRDADRNHFITSFKARDGSSFVWCGLTLDAGALHKGTKVASVALVQRFGVAKKATLISVKTTSEAVDNLAAIEMAYADISIKNPARAKKSVVNISWTLGNSANIEIPVVVASGNERKSSDLSNKAPATLYALDFPVIAVGGTDPSGNRDNFSQEKRANAVHAPGSQIDVSNKDGTKVQEEGTSFAAPAVCGLIATYMAYDTIPWDDNKMNNERVNEIRNHPRSDKCSVARGSDPVVRTIWNGIPKPDYEQVVISVLKTSKGWSLSVAMMSNVNSHSGGVEVSRARKCYTIKVGKSVGSCRETNPCAK
ncbi:peptidase S8/S53 domain-containing protein [Pyrenochaeta sp. MPI-SDFR-AT-0127]|nr:peptidase S8/S53 domain-containing protein [Pyrenochaeta sp. MPI-SDFR-AT-0127]